MASIYLVVGIQLFWPMKACGVRVLLYASFHCFTHSNSNENYTPRMALRVWETRSCWAVAGWKPPQEVGEAWTSPSPSPTVFTVVVNNQETECKIELFETVANCWKFLSQNVGHSIVDVFYPWPRYKVIQNRETGKIERWAEFEKWYYSLV